MMIFGVMPKPNHIANNGPNIITGTVCVTIRCGYKLRLHMLDISIKIAIINADKAARAKPMQASLSVTIE